MRKYIPISLFFLIFLVQHVNGQRWKRTRWDVQFGIGTSQFFGDLGGGSKDAAHFFGVRDLDFASTRPMLKVGAQYKILETFSAKTSFTWGMIHADDAQAGSEGRRRRNLHFRSPLFELAFQAKYFFIKEKIGSRYAISRGGLSNLINAYIFAGIGGIHFNPKASLNGEWYELQPLGTEGQGLKDEDGNFAVGPKYSLFELAFPVGIGAKYTLSTRWSIGFEIGARYTTTDYLDDASGSYFNYYDYYKAEDNDFYVHNPPRTKEELQVEFSDRHLSYETGENVRPEDHYPTPNENRIRIQENPDRDFIGSKLRGNDTYNDAYIFTVVYVNYKLPYRRSSLPKFR